ncbi:hypothetical protein BDK51DRAFT_39619 [Blyttiomyces helicus]|uniref:FAD-binding domain-containing protein n=1 Tax=Blyttiomyces helicus TaxID=388810 RepID=A0A4P9W136_9FUNG|nr:hypothetical protein BDK51DRAFT_39619 [Blyttiomyces helicus]|eukprot:RKO85352.1 hypothetical protein BDK51DRAFT_39619 [Blyttiomyces helicus]
MPTLSIPAHGTPPRPIVIIGGGIAGLTTALAIKRAAIATGLNVRPIIYEAARSYSTTPGPHWLLWRWAIDSLLELGLGKRLSRIARPIDSFRSVDAETLETLVQWPPPELATAPTTADSTSPSSATSTSSSAEDAEAGASRAESTLAPMFGVRRVDLIRLVLLALSDVRDDLYEGSEFVPAPANNADGAPQPRPQGIEGDLAVGDSWFEDEGYAEMIPDLRMGHELDTYMISASTGVVTAKFKNGFVERCFMMIGCDGVDSRVRDLLGNGRYPPQYANAVVIHGTTRVNSPPFEFPKALPDGRAIQEFLPEDLEKFCPDGTAQSFVGRGCAFGATNLGNGQIGWNLIVAQPEKHSHITSFEMARRRREVGAAVASVPSRQSLVMPVDPSTLADLSRIDTSTASPQERWQIPRTNEPDSLEDVDVESASPAVMDPLSAALAHTHLSESSPASQTSPGSPRSPNSPRTTRRNRVETAFERQLRENREELVARARILPNLLEPTTSALASHDAVDLALRLVEPLPLPPHAHALIARADPLFAAAFDSFDLADQIMDSCTAPNFHPGRVILIGDAAHPVATSAHGSLGGGLALTDAALLAKLLAKHLGATVRADDESVLGSLSREMDRERAAIWAAVVVEARAEGGWQRVENSWIRSIWRMSYRYNPVTWAKASYDQMLVRGAVKAGYVSLAKIPARR